MDKQERLFKIERAQDKVKTAMIGLLIFVVVFMFSILFCKAKQIKIDDAILGICGFGAIIAHITLKGMWFMLEDAKSNILNDKE